MHEMALTQGIVDICERNAAGRPVILVCVEIGSLSGVVPEAVEFCFEACTVGTLVAGARLEIEQVAGLGVCMVCQHEQPLTGLFEACTRCGSYHLQVIRGEELRVVEIEVAD